MANFTHRLAYRSICLPLSGKPKRQTDTACIKVLPLIVLRVSYRMFFWEGGGGECRCVRGCMALQCISPPLYETQVLIYLSPLLLLLLHVQNKFMHLFYRPNQGCIDHLWQLDKPLTKLIVLFVTKCGQ